MSNNNQTQPKMREHYSWTKQKLGTESGAMNSVQAWKKETFTQSGTMNLLRQSINNQTQQPPATKPQQQKTTNNK